MADAHEIIRQMEERIALLPVGYISPKTIKGKVYHYRQWREGGKIKSNSPREGCLMRHFADIYQQIADKY